MPPAMDPAPTSSPDVLIYRRQLPSGVMTSYHTIASDGVANLSLDPGYTSLPLDNDGVGTPNAIGQDYSTVTFKGVGGTLAATALTSTIVVTTSGPIPSSTDPAAAETQTSSTKQIPMTAVITAFVIVAVLCFLLMAFFWRKRRKYRQAAAADRERRQMRSHIGAKSFVGGHGHSTDREGPWEEFKAGPDYVHHLPGALPSPATTKYSYSDGGQSVLLSKLSSAPLKPTRRYSAKSTVTGKVNPNNNFAESTEEAGEDYDDPDETHSNGPPLSPVSGKTKYIAGPSAYQASNSLTVPGHLGHTDGDPSSFLTFRSGDADVQEIQQRQFVFTQSAPEEVVRQSPNSLQTPPPQRALTLKSQKSSGLSADGYSTSETTVSGNSAALSNLIAALDSLDNRRPSLESHRSGANTPLDQHIVPSPSDFDNSANPFRDNSFAR
ncbi:hypothetical protein FRB99_000167 [Tulasnella sp. 403]|nr:hypothetical protein FRB99_000167 [Tulasnella sp. 403]